MGKASARMNVSHACFTWGLTSINVASMLHVDLRPHDFPHLPLMPPSHPRAWRRVQQLQQAATVDGFESAFAPYVGSGVLMTSKLGTNMILMRYVTAITQYALSNGFLFLSLGSAAL